MVGVTLHSFLEAVAFAEARGIVVEKILTLDRPTQATRLMLSNLGPPEWKILECDLGDQGAVRNLAVLASYGQYVAFLDGDDLWSFNWLVEALAVARGSDKIIVHPQYNWMFGANNNLFVKIDQTDVRFDPLFLRYGNYWDALCLAPRTAYIDHPFGPRDMRSGYAYEDWHWNCETISAGWVHRVAVNTIHFKRRRVGSQTLNAAARSALMRPTELLYVDWTPPLPPVVSAKVGRPNTRKVRAGLERG